MSRLSGRTLTCLGPAPLPCRLAGLLVKSLASLCCLACVPAPGKKGTGDGDHESGCQHQRDGKVRAYLEGCKCQHPAATQLCLYFLSEFSPVRVVC